MTFCRSSGVKSRSPHLARTVTGRIPNRNGQKSHWVECTPSQVHHTTHLGEPPEHSRQFRRTSFTESLGSLINSLLCDRAKGF